MNTFRGMLSLGITPLRMIRGTNQSRNRRKKGNMERGATSAPVIFENNGNVVTGSEINAAAQSTSQTTWSDFLLLIFTKIDKIADEPRFYSGVRYYFMASVDEPWVNGSSFPSQRWR